MANLEFLPNSPTLLNAGHKPGQLAACFVLPLYDSSDSISEILRNTALIHNSGGGTGFCFSRLRPKRELATSGANTTASPLSFLQALSATTSTIMQGGIRRGCNMAVLNFDHPDILQFIAAKDDPDALNNFYLSVAVTKEFMQAVKFNAEYNLINPQSGEEAGRLNARNVFNMIVAQTWKTGDPGLVFIDRIERDNPTPQLGRLESICGCGEQSLLPYESCNLGSINLSKMLLPNNGIIDIDYPKLAETVKTAVRFLDNVIDVNKFPLSEIERITRKTRKIGLGVMGFADMLILLGIPYDSEKALEIANDIMRFINQEAHKASATLADERGVFPAFEGSIYNIASSLRQRNASCTTIAPTGTLSLIAGCSSGIEPLFAPVFIRNIQGGDHLLEVNPCFKSISREEGFYSERLIQKLSSGSRLRSLRGVPDEVKRLFVSALDIKGEWHVKMQGIFQKHTDNAVSKTVNLPNEATRKDIAEIYMLAYEEGLKGITIYRDSSRHLQPLCINKAA
jgi:ribonucleoside-diphosphate reductase alpha chain